MATGKIIFRDIKAECPHCFETSRCFDARVQGDEVVLDMECSKCRKATKIRERIEGSNGEVEVSLLCLDSKTQTNYWLIRSKEEKHIIKAPKANMPVLDKIPEAMRKEVIAILAPLFGYDSAQRRT